MTSAEVKTKMSRSEMVVSGLTVAMLMTGLMSGVFAKPAHTGARTSWTSAALANIEVKSQN